MLNYNSNFTPIATHIPTNTELQRYKIAFFEWLENSKDFSQFKRRITEELQRLGFSDWAYSRLDIPLSTGIDNMIGTTNKQQLEYSKNIDCYGTDFTFDYTLRQKKPIFRSVITQALIESPLRIDPIKDYLHVTEMYESFKYFDHFSVPIFNSETENTHANFTCSTKALTSNKFVKKVNKSFDKLLIIVNLIEEVGTDKFTKVFLGEKIRHDKFISGRPLQLLQNMADNDYGIGEAARAIGITKTAADKQIAKARDYLEAKTTHGALLKAIEVGYISTNNKKKIL